MFEQATSGADAWRLFYTVAGLCHPQCGGTTEQMQGLAEGAREALARLDPGNAWPFAACADGGAVPSMRDIFDHACPPPPPLPNQSGITATGNAGCCDVVAALDGTSPFVLADTFEPLAWPDGWTPVGCALPPVADVGGCPSSAGPAAAAASGPTTLSRMSST